MQSHFKLGGMLVSINLAGLFTAWQIYFILAAIYFILNPDQRKKTNLFLVIFLAPILGFAGCTLLHEIGHIIAAQVFGINIIALNIGIQNNVEVNDIKSVSLPAITFFLSGGILVNLLMGLLCFFNNGYLRFLAAVNLFTAALDIWPVGLGRISSDGFFIAWGLSIRWSVPNSILLWIFGLLTVLLILLALYIYLLETVPIIKRIVFKI